MTIIAGMDFLVEASGECRIIRLHSEDGTNRLSAAAVRSLSDAFEQFRSTSLPLIITGNQHFFSAGADLNEIAALTAPAAYEFAHMGQRLMRLVDDFPAPVIAAISGYCMGGGLDLALACDRRIAAPNAIFGHRGAALGLMTGWGGATGDVLDGWIWTRANGTAKLVDPGKQGRGVGGDAAFGQRL